MPELRRALFRPTIFTLGVRDAGIQFELPCSHKTLCAAVSLCILLI